MLHCDSLQRNLNHMQIYASTRKCELENIILINCCIYLFSFRGNIWPVIIILNILGKMTKQLTECQVLEEYHN